LLKDKTRTVILTLQPTKAIHSIAKMPATATAKQPRRISIIAEIFTLESRRCSMSVHNRWCGKICKLGSAILDSLSFVTFALLYGSSAPERQ
jgi:hypothetical protein